MRAPNGGGAFVRPSRAVLLAGGIILSALAGVSARAEGPPLVGFGSSYPGPLVNRLANDMHGTSDLLVDYTPVGSKHGRDQFLAGNADFALTDQPFQPDEADRAAADGRTYSYAPIAAGPLNFAFNVSDTEGRTITDIKLSPLTLAKIFTGVIGNWRDNAITVDNGSPINASQGGNIQIFFRSDANGTTWALSNWIKAVAPEEWRAFTTRFKLPDEPLEQWPSQNTLQSAASAEVAAQRTRGTSASATNALTYLPPPFAQAYNLPLVAVKNHAGNYVLPTSANAEKGLAAATVDAGTHLLTPNYDPPDPNAYLLVLATYAIAPLSKTTTVAQSGLASFLQFILDHPDTPTELGYARLPTALADGTKAVITQLRAAADAVSSTTTTSLTTTTTTTPCPTSSSTSSTATSTSTSSTTSSTAPSTTTTTICPPATTTTTTSPATTTTTAPPSTGAPSPTSGTATPSPTQAFGATLAATGALAWRWKLELGLLLAVTGELMRRRERRAAVERP